MVPLAATRRAGTWGLLGAVFLSGAVLLGVEMAASRVLAPYFGNSLFVWAAIIGVILGGLAVGYWFGGALADRFPTPLTLAVVIAGGAVAVLAIPLLDRPVIEWVLGWDPGPRLDPVLCAVLLFGPMSVLLSAVGPVAVRLQVRALPRVGRTAGRTFAISTAGSIAGTFVTAFWLIPELGIEQLFVFGAAALFGTAALVGAAGQLRAVAAAALAFAIAVGAYAVSLGSQHIEPLTATSAQNWSPLYRTRGYGYLDVRDPRAVLETKGLDVVFAEDTRYHRLAVVDDEETRYLRFDNSLQSAMYLGDPFRTRYRYTDFFHLGVAYNPDARNVLFVGLGAGSSEKRLWRDFPRLQIEAVELRRDDLAPLGPGERLHRLPDRGRQVPPRLVGVLDRGGDLLRMATDRDELVLIRHGAVEEHVVDLGVTVRLRDLADEDLDLVRLHLLREDRRERLE